MDKDLTFKPAPETPGLVMKVNCLEEGALDLVIDEVHDRVKEVLGSAGISDPTGRALSTLYEKDRQSFDEWTEFVLRAKYMPYVNMPILESEQSISGCLLQYFHCIGRWLVVTVVYYKNTDYATLSFTDLQKYEVQAGLWQQMMLRQYREMSGRLSETAQWSLDNCTRTVFLSTGLVKMLNIGEKSRIIPVRNFFSMIHPEDLDQVISRLDYIDQMTTFDCRFLPDNGGIVHLKTHAVPVFDDDGTLARIDGLSKNITEIRLFQERLAVSRDRFSKLAENSQDLFLVTDPQGEFTYVSPSSSEILNIPPEKLLGRKFHALLQRSPGDKSKIRNQAQEIIKNKTSGTVNCQIKVSGGGYRWFVFSIFTVTDPQGDAVEAIAIGHDITELKHRGEKLQYLSQHDDTTRTYNRTFFWNTLDELYKKEEKGFCLVLIDFNGLKTVNDMFGHAKGDQVLKEVAGAIKRSFSVKSHIARIGGDEFAAIVYHTDLDEIERRCAMLEEFCDQAGHRMLPLSVSWGISCRAASGSVQDLFKTAEAGLYNKKMLDKRSMHSQVIFSLKEALKTRNAETTNHLERMEQMVALLGKRLGLNAGELNRLLLLASMHDIGKLAIPDHIINKPGRLTDEEMAVMREHCEAGYRIAMASQELSGISQEILCHHERWDGTGYPSGKRGEEIPLLSRIVSVVDAYDVMTHRRVYQEPVSHKTALEELKYCSGTQFAPEIVNLFSEIFREMSEEELQKLIS